MRKISIFSTITIGFLVLVAVLLTSFVGTGPSERVYIYGHKYAILCSWQDNLSGDCLMESNLPEISNREELNAILGERDMPSRQEILSFIEEEIAHDREQIELLSKRTDGELYKQGLDESIRRLESAKRIILEGR